MIIGRFEGKVDEKSRVAFPRKFREVFGSKLIITQGFEHSLIVVSQKSWQSLLEGTQGKPFTLLPARQTQRFLLGNAASVELDEKGRFILPDYLRDFATIQTEIVFIGLS